MPIVTVTTAVELSKSLQTLVKDELTKKLKEKVELQLVVNPEVLGGISLTIGSNHLDATYKYKLEQISKVLKS